MYSCDLLLFVPIYEAIIELFIHANAKNFININEIPFHVSRLGDDEFQKLNLSSTEIEEWCNEYVTYGNVEEKLDINKWMSFLLLTYVSDSKCVSSYKQLSVIFKFVFRLWNQSYAFWYS